MFSRYGGTDFFTLNSEASRQIKLYATQKLYLTQLLIISPLCIFITTINTNLLLYVFVLAGAPLINFSEACERMVLMDRSSTLVAFSRTLLAPASNLLICLALLNLTNNRGAFIIVVAILFSLLLRALVSGCLAILLFGSPEKSRIKIDKMMALQTTLTAGASSLFIATDSILIKYFLTVETFIAYQAIMRIMIVTSVASFFLENRYLSSIFSSNKIDYSIYLQKANVFFVLIVLVLSLFQEILFFILKIDAEYIYVFYCVLFYKVFELNYSYFSTILSFHGQFYRQKLINVSVCLSNFIVGSAAAYYYGLYGIVLVFAFHIGLLAMLRMYYAVNSSFTVFREVKRVIVLLLCLSIIVALIEHLYLQIGAELPILQVLLSKF